MASARYGERPAPPGLRPWVACVWSLDAPPPTDGDADAGHLVLPDGCVDLVWHAGTLTVAGPDTGPTTARAAAGTTVGVRLRPGAAACVLGEATERLRDRRVPVDDLWGARGAELTARVADADAAVARGGLLVDAIAARIEAASRPDPAVAEAVALLGDGSVAIGGLARTVALSERQLRRRFAEHVGYGPKTLGRVLRLQRFLAAAAAAHPDAGRRNAGGGLAILAARAGYGDQAHLSREARALTGLTPTGLLRTRGLLAGG